MNTPSYTEEGARRRIQSFARKFGKEALRFACYAAVPVVLTVDFVHLLRINFFFDQSETLPYTTESDLLFSPLCTELGGGLYEMEPAVRNALLAELLSDEQSGQRRMREVATLLWEYSRRYSPWGNRLALERAQQLTALNFLDREKATRWLEEAEEQHRGGATEDREWFVAMQQELQKLEPVLSPATAPEVPPRDEGEDEEFEGDVPAGLRFIRQLRGRKSKITRIGWSPDGRTLAVPYKDKAIILWDTHTGEPRQTILLNPLTFAGRSIRDMSDRPKWAVQVAWSPDGKKLACGLSDSSILILNAENGIALHTLNGHSRSVNSVAWAPDGQTLASASDDMTVRLWDVNTGKGFHVFTAHTRLVNMVVWAPDGSRFASCADDSTIQIYYPRNRIGRERALRGHGGQIFSLAWSPDSLRIASGDDEGVIKIWDTRSWAETDTLKGHTDMVGSLSFSHNSRLLASKSWDGTVLIWRFDIGWETAARLDEPSDKDFALSLAFSPTAPTLATLGSQNTAVRLWETDYGRLLAPARPEAEPVVRPLKARLPVELFYSYSHKDEKLRAKLNNHLALLQRQGFITEWHDRMIEAGDDWESEINTHLDSAHIILLLVSDDFISSDYCYSIEMKRALERHAQGEARVIPVILRPVDWESSPLGNLQALPKNGKAISLWKNRDEGFKNVAQGIRKIIKDFQPEQQPAAATSLIPRRPVYGFVSRRNDKGRDIIEVLREELAPGRNQLVTLSGPGGVGKTTLAAEAARELQAVYKWRVVWGSADGRPDFTFLSLLDDIATQLGRADLRTLAPAEKEEQVRTLAAGALVVLDNYETVAEAARARIEAWFKRTQCSALFTSRTRVPGTLLVPVYAMSREEAEEFLEKLTGQTLDPQLFTPEVREHIYQTAEANPYVMQWLVGQMDLAQEPGAVLEELRHGEGDAAEYVFDRSFQLPLLGEDGRAALLALSLFAPNASREALAEVAGLGEDRSRLEAAVRHLRALWLVKGVDGNRRLAVEGLTRTLAAARLSKDPRGDEFRRRFVAYFLQYIEEREEPSAENYDALEEEKDNLLGAAEMAFASGDGESVTRMAYALARGDIGMLSVRGYWGEALKLGEQALQAARFSQDEAWIAGLLHNLALMYQNRGELAEARRLYDESLEIWKRLSNQGGVASSLRQLGWLAQEQGGLEEARRLYGESLEIARRLGDQRAAAGALHELGRLAQDRGELEEARRLYDESLEIEKRLGDQRGIAITLHQLAILRQDRGELEEARRLYGESLEITRRLGDQRGVAITLHQLGRLAEDEGDKEGAARLYRESLNIFERLGSPNAEIARQNLARVGGAAS